MTLPSRGRFINDLLYGVTGSGKTHQCALAADRMWRRHRKRTRLVAGDTGGMDTYGSLVDEGIVVPHVMVQAQHPIEQLDKLCQGYWLDANGQWTVTTDPEVGLYIFEGLTSFGDLMMRHLSAHKVRLSQDPAYTYLDGKTEFSGTNMSYYGEIQNRLYDFVVKSSVLPVERVIWTALEGRGEEEGTKSPTYGPAIVGKKATGKAGQWFGNMLHLEMLVTESVNATTKQVDIHQKRVMYTQPHADPLTKIPFPAKVRAPFNRKTEVPFMLDPPDIAKLYDMLEQLKGTVATQAVAGQSTT